MHIDQAKKEGWRLLEPVSCQDLHVTTTAHVLYVRQLCVNASLPLYTCDGLQYPSTQQWTVPLASYTLILLLLTV